MGRICWFFLGLVSCTTLRGSDAGKDWGVERQFYTDPITKTRIQELTQGPSVSDNLYFHISNFTADNRFLLFVSNQTQNKISQLSLDHLTADWVCRL